eukprot:XP_003726908.1 PREDICTED: uncharacterized protein LOC100891345 [Strongylocentrotus purpuratus]
METKQNNSISFLDVLFTKLSSGKPAHQIRPPSIRTTISPKRPHPPSPSTQRCRPSRPSGNPARHKIKSRTPASKPAANTIPEENQSAATPPKQTVVLPYIGQAYHKIQRFLQAADIQVRQSCSKKLHSILYSHKDKHPNHKKAGVYKIPCECGKVYIGETGRNLETRLKEHRTSFRLSDWDKSAIVKHAHDRRQTSLAHAFWTLCNLAIRESGIPNSNPLQ